MTRLNFNSWAARNKNEVHWADANHWRSKDSASPAKFLAHADEESFIYGFHLERPGPKGKPSADWESFAKWLEDKENDQWLKGIVGEEGLEVFDAGRFCFLDAVKPEADGWVVEGEEPGAPSETLHQYLDTCKENVSLDLVVGKRVSKEDALGRKEMIVDDIAKLFGSLMPLYDAASAHMG